MKREEKSNELVKRRGKKEKERGEKEKKIRRKN